MRESRKRDMSSGLLNNSRTNKRGTVDIHSSIHISSILLSNSTLRSRPLITFTSRLFILMAADAGYVCKDEDTDSISCLNRAVVERKTTCTIASLCFLFVCE